MTGSNGDRPCEDGSGERDARPRGAHALRRPLAALILSLLSLALLPAAALALPDGRGYEQVTPPNKHGADPRPIGEGFQGPKGGLIEASGLGNALTYVADSPVETEPEGNRSGEGNQVIAERTPTAWSSRDIVTRHDHGEGLQLDTSQEYRLFSPDLNLAAVTPFGVKTNPFMEPPLIPGSGPEERSIYRRNNLSCQAKAPGCFEAFVNKENVTTGTAYGGKLEYLGASPSLSATVFSSPEPLTSTSSGEPPFIYESDPSRPPSEQLQLVDVLPPSAGTPAPEPEPTFGGIDAAEEESGHLTRNAISEDGSRVFFTERLIVHGEQGLRELFMRDTATHTTIRIDAPEAGVKEPLTETFIANRRVRFQGASADGSRIFFTSNASLTEHSSVKPKEFGPVNLYVCEIPTTAPVTESTKCKLHDLTENLSNGVGDVLGMVSAITEDGSTVYFAANGATGEAKKGKCPNPVSENASTSAEHCYMYVAHLNGETWEPARLVATLSALDSVAWGRRPGNDQGELVARTSPNGRYFAFMSEEPLTGYDNRELNPAAEEKKRDEEVFLFDREAPEPAMALTCVSCNPNPHQRPRGIFDKHEAGEGFGPRVDPYGRLWGEEGGERWLAGAIPAWTAVSPFEAPYQSRFLLDDGRLYFNSADSLVPHDVETRSEPGVGEVGVMNVYQYEPEGIGSCETGKRGCVSLISSGNSPEESAFLDASTSGEDVFFLTAASLVRSDVDTSFDVYDAHICGSAGCIEAPEPPPASCGDEASCRNGGPSTPPSFGPAPSSTYSGPGNTPKTEVLGNKSSKPPAKKLTNAQKLAKALASCRRKYKHSRGKRKSCEREARRLYARHASVKHKKGKK